MKKNHRRAYVRYAQVLRVLGSGHPESILGKWYRGDTVRCSDCNRRSAEFTEVRSLGHRLSIRLHCSCGSVFFGSFGMLIDPLPGRPETFFSIDTWFSWRYAKALQAHCNRPEVKRALHKMHALMKAGSRTGR